MAQQLVAQQLAPVPKWPAAAVVQPCVASNKAHRSSEVEIRGRSESQKIRDPAFVFALIAEGYAYGSLATLPAGLRQHAAALNASFPLEISAWFPFRPRLHKLDLIDHAVWEIVSVNTIDEEYPVAKVDSKVEQQIRAFMQEEDMWINVKYNVHVSPRDMLLGTPPAELERFLSWQGSRSPVFSRIIANQGT